ncbi:MAG: hypothetical protein AAF907_05475, partial [Planctomycetota bacterium]
MPAPACRRSLGHARLSPAAATRSLCAIWGLCFCGTAFAQLGTPPPPPPSSFEAAPLFDPGPPAAPAPESGLLGGLGATTEPGSLPQPPPVAAPAPLPLIGEPLRRLGLPPETLASPLTSPLPRLQDLPIPAPRPQPLLDILLPYNGPQPPAPQDAGPVEPAPAPVPVDTGLTVSALRVRTWQPDRGATGPGAR